MLEPDRFPRLLRQVHDAEVADVRKLPDGGYEIERRPGTPVPRPRVTAAEAPGSGPVPEEEATQGVAAPTEPAVELTTEPSTRAGLRYRRGIKTPAAPPTIPLVGVVTIEEEAPSPSRASRKGRGARPEGADHEGPPRKPARSRGRKKSDKAE